MRRDFVNMGVLRATAISGVGLKFRIALKFCILELFFQSVGNSLSFGLFLLPS